MGQRSNTQMPQSAENNDSTTGGQTLGIPKVLLGTHYQSNWQRLWWLHVVRHGNTLQPHLDQQHPEASPTWWPQAFYWCWNRNTNTPKYGPLSRPHHLPNLWPALLKFDAALSIQFHQTRHTREDAGVPPIQIIRMKHNTRNQCTWIRRNIEQGNYKPAPHCGTTSHHPSPGWLSGWFVPTVGEPTRKSCPVTTLRSEMTPLQGLAMWHLRSRNRQQWDPQLKKRIDHEWPEDLEQCTLVGAESFCHRGVSLKVQYPPTRFLQCQPLVTKERFGTLEAPKDFMQAVCQHRHVFAADAIVEVAVIANGIRSTGNKKLALFICPSPTLSAFCTSTWTHTPTGLAGHWFVATGVTGFKNMRARRCNTLSHLMTNST